MNLGSANVTILKLEDHAVESATEQLFEKTEALIIDEISMVSSSMTDG